MTRTVLVRRRELSLDTFSRACGLHPDHVRRLVAVATDGYRRVPTRTE